MVDPSEKSLAGLKKLKESIEAITFGKEIYPEEALQQGPVTFLGAARCIFLPEKELMKEIIMMFLHKKKKEPDE
jgi:hypothetical protein